MAFENAPYTEGEPLFVDGKSREVAAPDFGGEPIADTHAHLDMLEDPAAAIARAALAGIGFIATVGDPSEDAARTYEDLEGWLSAAGELLAGIPLPRVRVILGVHPHNAKHYSPQVEFLMRELAANPLTAAVGEIGLDYHYDYSPRDVQRDVFRRQLQFAHERELPAVIHLREAHDDGLGILHDVGLPGAGCILHCYNLDEHVMRPFLELGCYVSFAGPVTFKKADEVRAAAAIVPQDRILTETDCPFMAPEPFRGRTNEPAYTVFTAARMAEARGELLSDFAVAAFSNAQRVLGRERT